MSKKQSRRTVSLPGPLFWALRAYCQRTGQPVAALVTRLVREHLELRGQPTSADRPPDSELKCGGKAYGGLGETHEKAHFTW